MRDVLGLTEKDPKYIEALTRLANLDLAQMRKRKAEDLDKPDLTKPLVYSDILTDLLYFFERNPPTPLNLFTTLLYFLSISKVVSSSSSSSSPSFKENKVRVESVGDSFIKIVDIYSSKLGRPTLDFLNTHRVSTLRELCNITKSTPSPMWILLRQLQDMEIVTEYGQVKKLYYSGHRPPTLFGFPDATDTDRLEAQRRYAILTLGYDPRKLQDVVTAQNKVNWTGDPVITVYNQYKDTNWTPAEIGASLRALGYSDNKLTTAMAKILGMLKGGG